MFLSKILMEFWGYLQRMGLCFGTILGKEVECCLIYWIRLYHVPSWILLQVQVRDTLLGTNVSPTKPLLKSFSPGGICVRSLEIQGYQRFSHTNMSTVDLQDWRKKEAWSSDPGHRDTDGILWRQMMCVWKFQMPPLLKQQWSKFEYWWFGLIFTVLS